MSICLSMIVKNEAHCIEKCLNSVKPFIDYWVICDTGSADNTIEVIQQCLSSIPGEIHSHSWVDFSTNRNLSLNLAKTKSDYVLIIDADDYLQVKHENVFNNLTEDCYAITLKHDNIFYYRNQLVKSSVESSFKGVLHEYLDVPSQSNHVILPDVQIVFGGSGSRSKSSDKYLKDIEVLLQGLEQEPDNSRYVFYLAQTYKDAGQLDKAYQFYLKRTQMGGWSEEISYAYLKAADCLWQLSPEKENEIENLYLKSYSIVNRGDSLFNLAIYLRQRNSFFKAYLFAKEAYKLGLQSYLFFNQEAAGWRALEEIAIAAYYLNKKVESKQILDHILNNFILNEEDRQRVAKSLLLCNS